MTTALAGVLAALSVTAAAALAAPMDGEQMTDAREQAAQRPRRIIFNNDADDALYKCSAATPEELLRINTAGLVGSQVDSIFYCGLNVGFGNVIHRSRVADVFTTTDAPFDKNITGGLVAQGTDPVQVMVDFCRRQGIEAFWSMRMNDTHDADPSLPMMLPSFKRERPQVLFSTADAPPKHGAWSGVDYARSEVRQMAFRIAEEVCRGYDVDGIELDFWRFPVFFKGHAMGEDVGDYERNLMTALVRRIRRMTEDVAAKRGRPLLVAIHIPDSVGWCEAIGLDVTRWLREGLVDMLVVGEYWQLTPWEESVRLGHEYGVPVYPCLSCSVMRDDSRQVRNSPEAYRARAMQVWNSGADGVYLFNFHYFYPPSHSIWRELGDPQAMRSLDKVYCASAIGGFHLMEYYLGRGEERFLKLPTLCPERPASLEAGQSLGVSLQVGDDLGTVEGKVPGVTVSVQVDGLAATEPLPVTMNGEPLTGGRLAEGWVDFSVEPERVKPGANAFTIGPAQQQTTIKDLQLRVSFGERP